MIIGVCTLQLEIYAAASLKDKRSVIKSVCRRLGNQFNVSVAEVDHLNAIHSSVIAIVAVSNDADYAHGLLQRAVNWVMETRLDCDLADYSIELLSA